MAYIPSWQELRNHPKTLRAARALDVRRTSVIGMLHCLWWWALDYAEEGDLTGFDDADIAAAAEWEGDPAAFVNALADCGVAGKPGFLDRHETGYGLHDWWDYGGKLVEQRARDAQRKRDVRATSTGQPTDGGRREDKRRVDKRNKVNPSVTNSTTDATDVLTLNVDTAAADPLERFDEFWAAYPRRNGKRLRKADAEKQWSKLTQPQRTAALAGVRNYASAEDMPMDAFRWLQRKAWADWQAPDVPDVRARPMSRAEEQQRYFAEQALAAGTPEPPEIGAGS